MCGIAVILPGSALQTPVDAIERMTAALAHRGPDAQQMLVLPGCQLGHTRLSIIDIAGGAQPMSDASGNFHIVFNGEIYNYRELRRELEAEGYRSRTRSDTEVLLFAYQRWGSAMLPRLNGQFAFAIWDQTKRTLFVARDRFGEKPLYWAEAPTGETLIASEIKSILASGLVQPRADVLSIDAYLSLFYVPPDRTVYENVHTVMPGHAAVFGEGECRSWRYWEPRYGCRLEIDETQAVTEVRRLLAQAVRRQTVADVPVGAFLSGGLDSSTIVALMGRESAQASKTFSVGFADLINELPFAREVAQAYTTEHHELQMDINIGESVEQMLGVYDEPFADSSNIPTYLVAQYARQRVKVVLSGDGGDEIFGGYAWYEPLLERTATGDLFERHLETSTTVLADRAQLWGPRVKPGTAAAIRAAYAPNAATRSLDRAAYFDTACYLPGDILVKVDRAAMAHGLETRAPFLDVELAEFVIGLPWELRFKNKQLKWLLRAACEDLWPASVKGRGKQGFGAPVRAWLQDPHVASLWDRVMRPGAALSALLPGMRDAAPEMRPQRRWMMLCLGLWLERNGGCLRNLR